MTATFPSYSECLPYMIEYDEALKDNVLTLFDPLCAVPAVVADPLPDKAPLEVPAYLTNPEELPSIFGNLPEYLDPREWFVIIIGTLFKRFGILNVPPRSLLTFGKNCGMMEYIRRFQYDCIQIRFQ